MSAKKVTKKLVRPQKGRVLAGVCAGIADYLGIDPTVVRVLWVFCSFPAVHTGVLIPGLLVQAIQKTTTMINSKIFLYIFISPSGKY